MIGLIIKDILNLRKTLGTSLIILLFFSFIAYKSQSPIYLISIFVFIMSMQFISSISYDEMAKWDIYALTMPISRIKLVISKYVLSILFSVIALIVSGTAAYFLILPISNMNTVEFLLSSYSIFAITMLFLSLLLPLIYKFGVEKARLLIFMLVSIPVIVGVLFYELGIVLPNEKQFMNLLKISPFIIIIVLFISSSISCRIYKGKDM